LVGEPKIPQRIGDSRNHRRQQGMAVVLELVRTRGPISKADLARRGRLKLLSVSEIIDALIDQGLIREAGIGRSTGGRPPALFELRPKARCAVGLSVGTRTLTAVVTDLDAVVERRIEVPSEMAQGPERLWACVSQTLEQLLSELPETLGEVLGIGLALPAPILGSERTTFSPPSYRSWGELNIGQIVEERFGFPVLMDNDANAAAIGEHLYGAGQGVKNLFYVIAHRGVGGAAILAGELYRGARGGAGEIGHTVIDLEGPRCGCGRFGCLEAFAGRAAIARRASRALKLAGGKTMNGREPDRVIAEDVIAAGLAGDEIARAVLEETGRYLGLGISSVVNMMDPELVVIGGSTMQAGALVLDPVTEVVRQRALLRAAERVGIVAGALGEDAGAIGAAALVLRGMFAVSLPDDQEEATEGGVLAS
jgi:N-acetylglucosamine repressor